MSLAQFSMHIFGIADWTAGPGQLGLPTKRGCVHVVTLRTVPEKAVPAAADLDLGTVLVYSVSGQGATISAKETVFTFARDRDNFVR